MEKSREITVKGIGNFSAKPDFVIVTITIEKVNKKYNEGYNLFAKDLKEVKNTIENLGFSKEEFRTSDISSSQKKDYEDGKYVFKGFVFKATLTLEFDFDNERLCKTYVQLSSSGLPVGIDIDFELKDKQSVENNLLASAAKDARKKAEILCDSLNAKLGSLIRVYYKWDDPDDIYFEKGFHRSLYCGAMAPADECLVEFNPKNIQIEDDALFVWEIE